MTTLEIGKTYTGRSNGTKWTATSERFEWITVMGQCFPERIYTLENSAGEVREISQTALMEAGR